MSWQAQIPIFQKKEIFPIGGGFLCIHPIKMYKYAKVTEDDEISFFTLDYYTHELKDAVGQLIY